MQALILAGGLGTRLRSVIQDLPKPMAPIRNRPFLEYLMDYWIKQGITAFYLSTGYLGDKIEGHFNGFYKGIPVHRIQEPKPLGTGGAILYALEEIPSHEDLVVVNGDTYFEIDFEGMKEFHKEKKSDLTIGLREVSFNNRYSGIKLNSNSKVELFAEREENSKHLLINAGVYLLNPDIFKDKVLSFEKKLSLEDELFPELIAEGRALYGFVSNAKFIDIGIPVDYEKAQTFLK